MADFFSNLLDRAFDRVPVIQPERAPLFAPRAQDQRLHIAQPGWEDRDVGAPLLEVPDEAMVDEGSTRRHAARPATRPSTYEPPAGDAAATLPTDDGRMDSTQPMSARQSTQPASALAGVTDYRNVPRTYARNAEAPQPDTIRIVERETLSKVALDENALFSRILSALPKTNADEKTQPEHRPIDVPQPKPVESPSDDNTLLTNSRSRAATDGTSAQHTAWADGAMVATRLSHQQAYTPNPVPASLVPTIRRAERNDASRAAVESAPTVHISIGRIEVRATQPTASHASAATRPRQPRLTLDAYLEQRRAEGGGR